MRAIELSDEYQDKLLTLLKKIFPGYKRIELDITSSGITVLFSRVGKIHPINITPWGKLVSSQVPFLEVFLRDIPKSLSKYGYDNESFAPFFAMQVAMYGQTDGDNLVKFLEETITNMTRPRKGKTYEAVRDEINSKFSNKTDDEKVARILGIPKEILNGLSVLDFFGEGKK